MRHLQICKGLGQRLGHPGCPRRRRRKNNQARLYVNGSQFNQRYGYVNLNNGQITIREDGVEPGTGADVVEAVWRIVQNENPEGIAVTEFLQQPIQGWQQRGIEALLREMDIGTMNTVMIPFRNDSAQVIADRFRKQLDNAWQEGMVERAADFCSDEDEFLRKLEGRQRQINNRLKVSDELKGLARKWFPHIRQEGATFKAVYRLSIFGVLKDYEVDYHIQIITTTIVRMPESEYTNHLYQYLTRYLPEADATKWRDTIADRKGETTLQKCLGALIDFVYQHIAKRRQEAIRVMEQAVIEGLESTERFKERVNTYFDSRLTRELRIFVREYGFGDLLKFLRERVDGIPTTASHLRGACDRLLVEYPENALFLMLRAIANAILTIPPTDEIEKDWDLAWRIFGEREHWRRPDRVRQMVHVIENVRKFDDRAERRRAANSKDSLRTGPALPGAYQDSA